MRRDELEVGIEREYALYGGTIYHISNLLEVERLLAIFHALRDERWQRMQAEGWRIAPEYSHCLLEIASPPYTRDRWSELLSGFEHLERMLDRAADKLQESSCFDWIECTANYSVRTSRFVTWDGTPVTTLSRLLLDPKGDNWLVGSSDSIPPCLVGCSPELLYAGFTSTNITVHPPMPDDFAGLADIYWRLLYTARQIDLASPHGHEIWRDGNVSVPPAPDRSIRDALIRWGDPATATLLDELTPLAPGEAAARFRALFGQPPSATFRTAGFQAYSCRPRVVEGVMLFELRCLHSGLLLANLAPLLAVR